jgi:hypothetical protein
LLLMWNSNPSVHCVKTFFFVGEPGETPRFYFTSPSCHTEGTRRRASNYKYLLTNDTRLRCYSTAENFGHLAGLYAESHNESLGVHHRKTQELDSQSREAEEK